MLLIKAIGQSGHQPSPLWAELPWAVGSVDIISLLPEQTDHSGKELGLGAGSQWGPKTLCPMKCNLSFTKTFYWRIADL